MKALCRLRLIVLAPYVLIVLSPELLLIYCILCTRTMPCQCMLRHIFPRLVHETCCSNIRALMSAWWLQFGNECKLETYTQKLDLKWEYKLKLIYDRVIFQLHPGKVTEHFVKCNKMSLLRAVKRGPWSPERWGLKLL